MPRRREAAPEMSAAVHTIQERLTYAAHAFAQEILRVLSESTLADLTMLTGGQADGAGAKRANGRQTKFDSGVATITKAAPVAGRMATQPAVGKPARPKKPSAQTSAVRRIAGTKPVECPFPDCKNPGVRSKMNFCREHAEALPRAERIKMRQGQRESHIPDRIHLPLPEPRAQQKKGAAAARKKS